MKDFFLSSKSEGEREREREREFCANAPVNTLSFYFIVLILNRTWVTLKAIR